METTESKVLLERLISEVELIDPEMMKVPSNPEDGDKPIATLPEGDFLRKLFVAMLWYRKREKELDLELEYDQDNVQLKAENKRVEMTAELLRAMFWLLVKEKYSLWNVPSIALRKGFNLVTCKEDNGGGPPDFLKKLFGME